MPLLSPLLVDGMPRSGTTILMHLLRSHPQLVTHNAYPYETRYAIWAWHVYSILSKPQEDRSAEHHWTFSSNTKSADKNPFLHFDSSFRAYFNGRNKIILKESFARLVDDFYLFISAGDAKTLPNYFVEKFPGTMGALLRSVYGDPYKEILITRDPREVFLSAIKFNRSRGRKDFGEDRFGDDFIGYYRSIANDTFGKMSALRYADPNGLWSKIIKYDDLYQNPIELIKDISEWLSLDWNQSIENNVHCALVNSKDSIDQRHITSDRNIGLEQSLAEVFNQELAMKIMLDFPDEMSTMGFI